VRVVLLVLLVTATGCATANRLAEPRSPVLRDAEGFAIASCLAHQNDPYLKDQGDGWASAIIQRGEGNLEALTAISKTVKAELAKGDMAVIRVESPSAAVDKPLPVMYCSEIIDKPAVRNAIKKAVAALAAEYAE
jgi:hypothetical protein